MTDPNFADFFEELHKRRPFPWQRDLAEHVVQTGEWHGLLDLPTGAGKTAVIDVAVFALALEADRPEGQPRRAALRTFFVVDRRIVVDEAARRARRIAARLRAALHHDGPPSVVREVARRLAKLAGWDSDDPIPEDLWPLRVAVLRGGMYRDDSWADAPAQPIVCASTVDQVGSRLLFRGYGLGRSGRVVHAGLIGADSLILLDEAHLSRPFLDTAKAIEQFRQSGGPARGVHEPALAFRVVSMSATPGEKVVAFRLTEADRRDQTLRRRLTATKNARLDEEIPTVKNNEEANQGKLARRLADHAIRLSAEPVRVDDITKYTPRVIGVVVNRVDTARRAFQILEEDAGGESTDVILLTGRVRPIDRDRLLSRYLERMRAGRDRGEDAGRLFVCATQTIECGADLDFDALVTEIAPLDALRQRFGRLDRLGELGVTNAVIVARKDSVTANSPDPIYDDALVNTWKWLIEQAGTAKKKDRMLDFGIDPMDRRVPADPDEMGKLRSPRPKAPILLPAHLDTWVQTDPNPEPDPDVSLFLHGPQRSADVQIVWRADLPEDENHWCDVVALAPPSSLEALPVPIHAARAWLESSGHQAVVGDVEGQVEDQHDTSDRRAAKQRRRALRWLGPERSAVIRPEEMRPGDTIVVSSTYGGSDSYGWNPASKEPVKDIGDLAALLARGKPLLRIHSAAIAAWQPPTDEGQPSLADRVRNLLAPSEDEEEEPRVQEILNAILADPGIPRWARIACERLRDDRGRDSLEYPAKDGRPGLVLRGKQRLPLETLRPLIEGRETAEADLDLLSESDSEALAGDDANSFRRPGHPVTLADHCEAVGELAARFAAAIGLPEFLVRSLKLAGLFHDLGKLDPRFQVWLCGGDEFEAMRQKQPLAKSQGARQDRESIRRARERSGYPEGARHEALSVALISSNPEISALSEGASMELVRYLIGTHHGRGRPFWPVVRDDENPSVHCTLDPATLRPVCSEQGDRKSADRRGGILLSAPASAGLERLDSGWTDTFWRLMRDYGPWGLALLEAILILADHQRSRTEQEDRS